MHYSADGTLSESENSWKSVAVPESVQIYNAQTGGTKHKSMVTSALKVA